MELQDELRRSRWHSAGGGTLIAAGALLGLAAASQGTGSTLLASLGVSLGHLALGLGAYLAALGVSGYAGSAGQTGWARVFARVFAAQAALIGFAHTGGLLVGVLLGYGRVVLGMVGLVLAIAILRAGVATGAAAWAFLLVAIALIAQVVPLFDIAGLLAQQALFDGAVALAAVLTGVVYLLWRAPAAEAEPIEAAPAE